MLFSYFCKNFRKFPYISVVLQSLALYRWGFFVMITAKSEFATLVKKRAPHIVSSHCILHRHALTSKTLPEYLKLVTEETIQLVHFVRSRVVNRYWTVVPQLKHKFKLSPLIAHMYYQQTVFPYLYLGVKNSFS